MTTTSLIQPLAKYYLNYFPGAAAESLENRPKKELVLLLEKQNESLSAAWLSHFSELQAAQLLEELAAERSAKILQQMEIRNAAPILSAMKSSAQEEVSQNFPKDYQEEIQAVLQYASDRAGAFMDPRALRFYPKVSVKEVLARIRKQKELSFGEVFVVDENKKLLGVVSLTQLMLSETAKTLGELMDTKPVAVFDFARREEVIEIFEKARLAVLPVVDYSGRFLGVISQKAMMDVVEEEALADLQTMVGASSEERTLSKVFFAVKKRLPWLHINLLTAFLAAAVVGLFEGTIAKFTALAVLLPVVAGQSGNSGAQALAVTLRGLALREVRTKQWMRIAFKEARVGILNGIAIAITTSVGVYIWSRSWGLSLIIALAMVISMTAAGLAGAVIPLSLTALKQDPAQSASIFLTTVTDIVGFLSFLGLATLLSGLL